MIDAKTLRNAIDGISPATRRKLSLSEFGKVLAPFRSGAYESQPYRRQTISLYLKHPERQGDEFVAAFERWRQSIIFKTTTSDTDIATRVETVVIEHVEIVERIGAGEVERVLAVAALDDDVLLRVNGRVVAVHNRAGVRVCDCGRAFVVRSWNQRRCAPNCKGKQ